MRTGREPTEGLHLRCVSERTFDAHLMHICAHFEGTFHGRVLPCGGQRPSETVDRMENVDRMPRGREGEWFLGRTLLLPSGPCPGAGTTQPHGRAFRFCPEDVIKVNFPYEVFPKLPLPGRILPGNGWKGGGVVSGEDVGAVIRTVPWRGYSSVPPMSLRYRLP